jgi:hypothetical protein
MSGSLLELLHPCIQNRRNSERGRRNAEPLENSRQSFQHFTARHQAAVLRGCIKTACLNRSGLLRLLFTDSVSATKTVSKRWEYHYEGSINTFVRIGNIHFMGQWKAL